MSRCLEYEKKSVQYAYLSKDYKGILRCELGFASAFRQLDSLGKAELVLDHVKKLAKNHNDSAQIKIITATSGYVLVKRGNKEQAYQDLKLWSCFVLFCFVCMKFVHVVKND